MLVFLPMYHESIKYIRNSDSIISVFRQSAETNNFIFLSYLNDSISLNKEYFYNANHLNIKGAEIFSRKFAGDIINYIK
jgi:hypothetical protein